MLSKLGDDVKGMERDGLSLPELGDDFDDCLEPNADDEPMILLLGADVTPTGSPPALGAMLLAAGFIVPALVLSLLLLLLLQFTYCGPVHGSLSSTQTAMYTVLYPFVVTELLRQSQLLSKHAEPKSEQSTKLAEPLEPFA